MSTFTTNAPATTKTPEALGEPVTDTSGQRSIKYEWDIGDAGEGRRRMAVLRISHRTAGVSILSGGSHPNHFSATLVNEDVDGRSRASRLFADHSIETEVIGRFSQPRLEAFAKRALQKLRELHAAQDPAVLAYFKGTDAQATAV